MDASRPTLAIKILQILGVCLWGKTIAVTAFKRVSGVRASPAMTREHVDRRYQASLLQHL